MRWRTWGILGVTLSHLLGTSAVQAQAEPKPRGDAVSRTVDDLYAQSKAALARKDWPEAYKLLRQAWDLAPSYDIAGNLGHAALKLGRAREAAEYLSYCIANLPPSSTSYQRSLPQQLLVTAKKEITTVRVTLTPPTAELLIDRSARKLRQTGTNEVYLDPGSHTLEAHQPGYRSMKATITATAGAIRDVTLALESETAPVETPAAPLVSLQKSPPATESEKKTLTTPAAATEQHSDGGVRPKTAVIIAGGSLTLVATGIGIYFAARANSLNSQEERQRATTVGTFSADGCASAAGASSTACTELASLSEDRAHFATASEVAFIAAGALGAATLATFFLWRDRASTQASAWVTPNSFGFAVSGSLGTRSPW